ncbi:PKD domain-containing protein [Hymenobacter nivis]|uniref:PKD domain-containing protein n=1 Tax=Hymenobacter nivis TaxID=1850093 RepID=A0A502GYV0_9BACT|nr:PKD domain-containing protein [Hymenobacter nivis]TPG67231.1 PKD domain-containing protein [Hymenobacter nivis]
MNLTSIGNYGRAALLGALAWAAAGAPARAQTEPDLRRPRPTARAPRQAPAPAAYQHTDPNSRISPELQQVYQQGTAASRGGAPVDLKTAHPQLRLSKDATAVLVHITAKDVAALLPALQARGFVVVASRPDLHFVDGMLPLAQLAPGAPGLEALAAQGLLGILPVWRPMAHTGRVTTQADYVLEAARARATRPKGLSGAGVRIGILSDSYNSLKGAANDVASGDLPAAGVQVLSDLGDGEGTDEGRAMAQLVYDIAPGAPLAFSTAYNSEADFAQHILDLADPAKGNCKVIVDDIAYFAEPYFQDGVVAQAVTQVVSQRGATYFSSAGNNGDQSYENAAPAFVAGARNLARLNFNTAGGTDVAQRFSVPSGADMTVALQWSDPFYTTAGVKTDLDAYILSSRGDTVDVSNSSNLRSQVPFEITGFTNDTSQTHTTLFDLVIVRRTGTANPTRIKYIALAAGQPTEWLTNSGTVVGHAAAAAASAVAAVAYFDPKTPESYTSKGSPTILFNPDGTALGAPVTRPKPDFASVDGGNTTFFGDDAEGDGLPNFFGTSAAAPAAAAVAALLLQSEPALTPAQLNARLASTARPVGGQTGFSVLTGAGLIDAFTAIYGGPVAVTPPAVEDLEKQALPVSWTVNSTKTGRVQVATGTGAASGTSYLVMDAAFAANAAFAGLNEAVWYAKNTPGQDLLLTFRQRKFAAETDNALPTQFTGSSNGDGVALSVDGGNTWYRVVSLTGASSTTTYQTQSVNLTQFAATNNLTLGTDVRVKFQQYGTGPATASAASSRRGMAFDDIALTSAAPAPVPLYTSTQPLAGCPGLVVAFRDSSLFKPTSWAWTFAGGTPATSTDRNPTVTYNTPGRFAVTLAATNANGTATRVDTGYVVVYGRAPQATAVANRTRICPGGTVSFTSQTAFCPGTYAWSFPGGSPAAASTASATVSYAAAGTYVATLTVSNGFGSTTSTVSIEVTAGRTLPFAETFDTSTTLPAGWIIENPDGLFTWVLADGIIGRAGTSTRAARAPFAPDAAVGQRDVLQTPPLNLSAAQPTLRFDLAYAPITNAASAPDSLVVQVLDACTLAVLGRPYAKGATGTLGTATPQNAYFVPSAASQWRQELVDLTPYAGKSVLLRFVGYNGYGNYLYVDNVNVGSQLLALTSAAAAAGLEAWPNPTAAGTALHVRLPAQSGGGQLRLIDDLGRTVWHTQLTAAAAATEQLLTTALAPGLYSVVFSPVHGVAAARRVLVQ